MARLNTVTFTGKSGKKYEFNVYPMDEGFKAVGAVYVITRRIKDPDGSHAHKRIYTGETGDLSERFDDHHKAQCFRDNNANCVCTHVDNDKQSRLAKETDLLGNYTTPCND